MVVVGTHTPNYAWHMMFTSSKDRVPASSRQYLAFSEAGAFVMDFESASLGVLPSSASRTLSKQLSLVPYCLCLYFSIHLFYSLYSQAVVLMVFNKRVK